MAGQWFPGCGGIGDIGQIEPAIQPRVTVQLGHGMG
jgi:hypothetical protein